MIKSAEAHEFGTTADRRFLMDRRQYSYDHAIPERRSGKDRRQDIGVVMVADFDAQRPTKVPNLRVVHSP